MKTFFAILATLLITLSAHAQVLNGVVNVYTSVSEYGAQCGCITVASARGFQVGDRVMIIQMQGATVSTAANAAFGAVTSYNNTGKFEFSNIASIYGNTVTLMNQLNNSYDFTNGSVQLIKVATGTDIIIAGTVQPKAWDGTTGGVVVIEACNSLLINAPIDATGKGFRGGVSTMANLNCNQHGYSYDATSMNGAHKGEGVAKFQMAMARGRGGWANGGGGGNNHNSGGGGGGNAFMGGFGGYSWSGCSIKNDAEARGMGGFGLNYSASDFRVFMGGGAGAGHRNDVNNTAGGNGGGIIIIVAPTISVANGSIVSRGGDAAKTDLDGAGGGGAGGTVVLFTDNVANSLVVDVTGGKGGDCHTPHGPGGGGSAGVVLMKQDQMPATIQVVKQGGASGKNYESAPAFISNQYGSTNGDDGFVVSSVRMPLVGAPTNTVRVNVMNDVTVCANTPVQITTEVEGGVAPYAYTWSGSDINDTTTSIPTARPKKNTKYICMVRDSRGCVAVDSVTVTVADPLTVVVDKNKSVCKGNSISLDAFINGGSNTGYTYKWEPTTGLTDATVATPLATPTATTTYTLTVTDFYGCSKSDSVTVKVNTSETPVLSGAVTVCTNSTVEYRCATNSSTKLLWSVSGAKDMVLAKDGKSATITWGKVGTGKISVSGDVSTGTCVGLSSMTVSIQQAPEVSITATKKNICEGETTTLTTTSAFDSYRWNNGSTERTITVDAIGTYTVEVSNNGGCTATSNSISIEVAQLPHVEITTIGNAKPCSNETVTLDAGVHTSYKWNTGATTRTITPSASGEYSVTVTNTNGCSATSEPVTITVGGVVTPSISGKVDVCRDAVAVYTAKGLTGSTFEWNVTGATSFTPKANTVTVVWSDNAQGKISVKEQTQFGCNGTSETSVTIHRAAQPTVAVQKSEIYDDETTTLDAGDGFATYLWNNGATTRTITVNAEGNYSVAVTTTQGCSANSGIASIKKIHRAQPRITTDKTAFCTGLSTTLDAGTQYNNIRWNNGATTRTITVSQKGNYYFTATLDNGTELTSDTIKVIVWDNPQPYIIKAKDALVSSVGGTYQWYRNGEAVQGATDRMYTPTESGKYNVMVTYVGGCKNISEQENWLIVPNVTVTVPSTSATVGTKTVIKLEATSADEQVSTPHTFTATISFDKTMLMPTGATKQGTIVGNKRYITVTGTSGFNGTLDAMEFVVLAGATDKTDITIESVTFGDTATITKVNGEFIATPVCPLLGNQGISTGTTLQLFQNYPNPVTENTTIEYTLNETGTTELSVVDMSGKTVAVIVSEHQTRGSHSVTFNASELANGKYVIVLTTVSKQISKNMIVSK